MCWTLLAGGMCFYIEVSWQRAIYILAEADSQNQQLRTTLVAVFVYIFTAFYSIGEGPVP
jgi:hypothetical protein